MKTSKQFFKIIASIVFLMVLSNCSESTADEGGVEDEPCIKTCRGEFVLNEETCNCEEEVFVCEKVCETGFTLNDETCECEEDPVPCTLVCDSGETLNEETCECEAPFVPTVIAVEAETATLVADWKEKTDNDGYTGNGYIVWEGAAQFWKGAEDIGKAGLLTYKINVTVPGTYLFQWRSFIAKLADEKPATEHNDSWLRMPDADNFYGFKNATETIVYPKGSGKTPNPAGENGNGFFKIYTNTIGWSWTSSTSDHNPHQVYATFSEAKEYTIEISARSNYHGIDSFRLTLQKPE